VNLQLGVMAGVESLKPSPNGAWRLSPCRWVRNPSYQCAPVRCAVIPIRLPSRVDLHHQVLAAQAECGAIRRHPRCDAVEVVPKD
jgi:hypothetical protein